MCDFTMLSYHKCFFFMLFFIVYYFPVLLGENPSQIIKEEGRHEKRDSRLNNPIPIHQTYSPSSFVARVKCEVKENQPKITIPSADFTRSSQLIQFTPALHRSGYRQFTPPNYVQSQFSSTSCVPAFLQFQQQQPGMQLLVGFNGPFYCTYIPVSPTYQFPEVPGITDFNPVLLQNVNGNSDQAEIERVGFSNPFKQLFKDIARDCPINFYRCNDGTRCISKLNWCDNRVDCPDASDEAKCSCPDRIGQERLCDNYPDCPHSEDERGCFGCPKNTFSCNDSPASLYNKGGCISQEQRCDGRRQCANGRDEENCSILTELFTSKNEIFPVGYNVGFLQRNFQGKWYPVCGQAYTWAKEACAAEFEYMSEDPRLEMINTPYHRLMGPYLMESSYEEKSLPECAEQVAFVRCPAPANGRRMTSQSRSGDTSFLLGSEKKKNASDDPIVSIVGGHDSLPHAWPFIVAINKNGYFHCGGAILNEWWVLSAAHCFADYQRQYYEVDAGMLRRFSYSPIHQIRRLDSVIVHPNYDPSILKNDLALGLLNEQFFFNRWVRPVRLPTRERDGDFFPSDDKPSPGSTCVAVGWGAIQEGGTSPDHLREVDVPIINCIHSEDRNRAEICAGFRQGGRDACQGDSGGPLMCRVDDEGSEWYVGGIVSHGIGCGRWNEPGAYTKVSHFVDWIYSIINTGRGTISLVRTRSVCPGFSCNRPYAHCLPAKRRCDHIVDCLEAEDEINCPFFSGLGFIESLLSKKVQEPNLQSPAPTSAQGRSAP